MDFNAVKLNLNVVLPRPEEHEQRYIENNAREVATGIREAMGKNHRELITYNLNTQVIKALKENGFKVLRLSNGLLKEYKIEW